MILRFLLCIACVTCFGCMKMSSSEDVAEVKSPEERPKPGLKTTDEIGEFDPDAEQELVDSQVKVTNPITGPLEAYEPLKLQVSELAINQAVELFRATEGRYPKNYEEFMARVIRANSIRLPQPAAGTRYEYDVDNHRLVLVRE